MASNGEGAGETPKKVYARKREVQQSAMWRRKISAEHGFFQGWKQEAIKFENKASLWH